MATTEKRENAQRLRRARRVQRRLGVPLCFKVRYPDRAAAAAALELRRDLGVVRTYFCWQCQAWHLTSRGLRG